ncbi:MAG: hypothetical protein KGQ41_08470 [Alphaproteobacteria bacterium]|nr:hypothetical protein [Alphaproteobacteria bacterium]
MMLSLLKRSFHTCLVLVAVFAFGLSGCSDFENAENSVRERSAEVDRALKEIEPKPNIAQPLMIDQRPYFGSEAVPLKNGAALPSQYEQSGSVIMTFARPVSVDEFVRMIQAVTGIRATAPEGSTSASASSDSSSTSAKTFIPADGEQVSGGRVVWQGRLSDLLNQASDVYGADWSYDGSTIQFLTEVTRTFTLHALASELSMSGSIKSGGGSEDAGSLPSVDITSTSSMKVWSEIEDAIKIITGGEDKAAFSPSTGTITVTGSPEVIRRVESYLNQQNAMRLRRVGIALKVISVTTRDALSLTGNLTGIIERAFDHASLRTVGDGTNGLSIGILKSTLDTGQASEITEDRLVSQLQALKSVERAAVSHSGALITLSDQPAPLQVGRQVSYLARTSSTTGDTGGSVSLEPDTLNLGLMMTVLPRIVEQNKILMRVSIAITDAPRELTTFESGDTRIQLPEVSTTGFLQNAVLTSGETMVLAGFQKDEDSSTEDGAPIVPFIAGGEKAANKLREVTIMLITAEILPEDPISVVNN